MIPLLSPEIEEAVVARGIPIRIQVGVLECDDAIHMLTRIAPEGTVTRFSGVDEALKSARGHRLVVMVVGARAAAGLLRALGSEALQVAVIGFAPEGSDVTPATLRSIGVMDVLRDLSEETAIPMLKRGLDYRALFTLELAHRCESRRLHRRELELLGHPPETMSDDLNTFQPPPLPVGPLSTYNLDEASEAFEKAYIDRVQQLCASAREAAIHLGVSSATLSRRTRREHEINGD